MECSLFPDIQNLYLRTISPEESLVLKLTDQAKAIFHRNLVGPRKLEKLKFLVSLAPSTCFSFNLEKIKGYIQVQTINAVLFL